MYKIKKLTILGSILMLMFGLTSCLKNTDSPNVSGAQPVIGLMMDYSDGSVEGEGGAYNNGGEFNVFNRTVKFYPSADTAYLDVTVSYLGSGNAPQDIQVSLAVDNDLLASFNAESSFQDYWGITADIPDASDIWSIPASVTIPKGQKSASVKIKLKNSLELGYPYAIPLKITQSSYGTVSTNQASAIYLFQHVNLYDGQYMVNGNLTDNTKTYTGSYPKYVEFWTMDDNTVIMYDRNYGNFYYIIANASTRAAANLSGVGFRFDATGKCTNVIGVAANTGAYTSLNFGTLASGASNQFTPQTVSYSPTPAFTVNFTASSGRFNINDKYTYVGERNDAN